MSDDPVRDALRDGIAALLRGDTAERDRMVERARRIMDGQDAKPNVTASGPEIIRRFLMIAERQAGRPLTERESSAIKQNPKAFGEYLIKVGYKVPDDIAAGTYSTN